MPKPAAVPAYRKSAKAKPRKPAPLEPDSLPPYCTVWQLASTLLVSERTVRRWIADESTRISRTEASDQGHVRISRAEVQKLLAEMAAAGR